MSPWLARATILVANLVMVVIRAPHGQRSRTIKVAKSHRGALENVLLTLVWIAFFLPILWIASSWLAFADYPLRPIPYAAGCLCLALGLWLFHRAHADLGPNWSITLELRESHQLVTRGVYRRVRHPMYSALALYSLGHLLALPNWVAGPSQLVAFAVLFAFRVGPEERMMREQFGHDYEAYAARTKRLVPGVW